MLCSRFAVHRDRQGDPAARPACPGRTESLRSRAERLENGTDALDTHRSEDRTPAADDAETEGDIGAPADGARAAGLDAAVLERFLAAMEPDERREIRELCARDLERTREGAVQALREWDTEALARHLHVMTSLAQMVGAEALAGEARRLQSLLRSGATTGYDAAAARMDDLARRAGRFLAEGAA